MHDLVRRIKMLEYALKAERSALPPPFPPPSSVCIMFVFEHECRCQCIKPTSTGGPDNIMLRELGFTFPLTFHCIVKHVHGCDNNYLWYSHNIKHICVCVYKNMGIVWRVGYTSTGRVCVWPLREPSGSVVILCMYMYMFVCQPVLSRAVDTYTCGNGGNLYYFYITRCVVVIN
jgi:hypothetical protein